MTPLILVISGFVALGVAVDRLAPRRHGDEAEPR
jgi:hypothetical protein